MALVSGSPVPIRGGKFMYLYPDDDLICPAIAETGEWEPDVAEAIERYANPDWTFLDLGAHIGFFSIVAGYKYHDIIAVEPHPVMYYILLRNMYGNGVKFEPHNVAVTDHDGFTEMFLTDGENTGESWVTEKGWAAGLPVPCQKLDTILQGRHPEVIKADIEGAEPMVFAACPDVLRQAQVVIVEYCDEQFQRVSGVSGREYYDMLTGAGLTVCDMVGTPIPFGALPTEGYTNILAIRRNGNAA